MPHHRAIALSAFLFFCPAYACAMTGEEFLSLCSPTVLKQVETKEGRAQAKSGAAFCMAWVRGITEGHTVSAAYYKQERLYCVDNDESLYSDLVGIVGSFVEANESKRSLPLAILTLQALRQRFPCKK
jgi:hypothetical protein